MRKLIGLSAAVALAVAAVPAFAATRTVKVADNVFSPAKMTVKKGTTVRWVWVGEKRHNVRVTSGPQKFASELQLTGDFPKKLRRKGTYRIVCDLHAEMKMTVKVR
jgi:plastocyanin